MLGSLACNSFITNTIFRRTLLCSNMHLFTSITWWLKLSFWNDCVICFCVTCAHLTEWRRVAKSTIQKMLKGKRAGFTKWRKIDETLTIRILLFKSDRHFVKWYVANELQSLPYRYTVHWTKRIFCDSLLYFTHIFPYTRRIGGHDIFCVQS